jgi:hypothetical protein
VSLVLERRFQQLLTDTETAYGEWHARCSLRRERRATRTHQPPLVRGVQHFLQNEIRRIFVRFYAALRSSRVRAVGRRIMNATEYECSMLTVFVQFLNGRFARTNSSSLCCCVALLRYAAFNNAAQGCITNTILRVRKCVSMTQN